MSAHASSPACLPSSPLLRWAPALIACTLATACGGGDPSQDSLAAVGSLGASSGRSNVTALAHSVGAMEARLAAVEGRAAITVGAAAGTYRLISLGNKAGSTPASMMFTSSTSGGNGTITLAPDGTFTYSSVQRMSGYTARLTSCSQVPDFTSAAAPNHNHQYTRTNCSPNPFVSTHRPTRETETGGGTWRVGPRNTLIVTPGDGAAITVYLVQGGAMGFSLEVDEQTDGDVPATRLALDVFIKQ